MAKNNKYASINFNHIYEKSITTKNTTTTTHSNSSKNPSLSPSPSPSSSSSYASASYSAVSAPNKPHGRILVLTRPTPKPVTHSTPAPPQPPPPSQPSPIQTEPGSDAISLRPLGRTGSGPSLSVPSQEKDRDLPSPRQPLKPNKFVPPHLRPGYVPREERPGADPGRLVENGRPKSGGLERMRRGGGSEMGRGVRPSSSG